MKYRLVIFDMDGTLTEELLDFDAIRADIGLSSPGPILEAIARMSPEEAARAHAVLDRHESNAAASCLVRDGAAEVLQGLRDRGLRTALLTRNSARCTQAVLDRHKLALDHVSTRDNLPYKPHPESILQITRKFGIWPEQTLMVGDYLYDLQAARAAGVDSVLLCVPPAQGAPPRGYTGDRARDPAGNGAGDLPPFADQANYIARSLRDILAIVDGRATDAPARVTRS